MPLHGKCPRGGSQCCHPAAALLLPIPGPLAAGPGNSRPADLLPFRETPAGPTSRTPGPFPFASRFDAARPPGYSIRPPNPAYYPNKKNPPQTTLVGPPPVVDRPALSSGAVSFRTNVPQILTSRLCRWRPENRGISGIYRRGAYPHEHKNHGTAFPMRKFYTCTVDRRRQKIQLREQLQRTELGAFVCELGTLH